MDLDTRIMVSKQIKRFLIIPWYKCDSKILITSDFYAIIKDHLWCLRFSLSNVQND